MTCANSVYLARYEAETARDERAAEDLEERLLNEAKPCPFCPDCSAVAIEYDKDFQHYVQYDCGARGPLGRDVEHAAKYADGRVP